MSDNGNVLYSCCSIERTGIQLVYVVQKCYSFGIRQACDVELSQVNELKKRPKIEEVDHRNTLQRQQYALYLQIITYRDYKAA